MNRDLSDMFFPWERRNEVRRDYSKKRWRWLVVLLVIFALAWAYQALALTPEYLGAETARAEEIHQNDYYCQQIKDGKTRVIGAEGSLAELCAKWGVAL